MQHSRLKIISILMCVLFFSDAVSEESASLDSHPIHAAISAQFQQAIQAMEEKAAMENQLIQALNERIVQLEQKITALNTAIAGRGTSGSAAPSAAPAIQTENAPVALNQPQPVPTVPNQARQTYAGSATMRVDKQTSEPFFNLDDWQNWQKIISPYVIPVSIGLLIILMIFALRASARKHEKIPGSGYNMGTVVYNPDEQNPIVTDEKSALLAQKLAALRSAVEQSKQRRKSDM